MSDKQEHVIVLIENYWEGYASSVAWFATLAACIAYAVWIESTAMQWIMGVFWFFACIGWNMQRREKIKMPLDEAIARLDELKKTAG